MGLSKLLPYPNSEFSDTEPPAQRAGYGSIPTVELKTYGGATGLIISGEGSSTAKAFDSMRAMRVELPLH